MKKFLWLLLPIVALISIDSKIIVDRVELCSTTVKYPMIFDLLLKMDANKNQILDVNITIPAPVGKHIGVKIGGFFVAAGRSLKLGGVKEDDTCHALNTYFGEFWYDVARAANCPPKKCPIAKGKYYLKDYKLNFDALPITLPFGTIRVEIEVSDFRNKSVWYCGKAFVNHD